MGYRRPSSYPYPGEFRNVKDVEDYTKRMYAALLENDSRAEYVGDRSPDKNLKELIVRPEWYGAKGDGVTDDTAAIQAAITAAGTTGAVALAPGATYLVTDTVGGTGRLNVFGYGWLSRSTIRFRPSDADTPLFWARVQGNRLRDFFVGGADTKGIALRIGNTTGSVSSNRSLYQNLWFHGLNIGVLHEYGWINRFDNVFVDYCDIGIDHTIGNNTHFSGLCAEVNRIGVRISGAGVIYFDSPVIEGNTESGLVITGGTGIVLDAPYFEGNGTTHISAGEGAGNEVGSLCLNGPVFSSGDDIIIDRVGEFRLSPAKMISQLQITENARCVNVGPAWDFDTDLDRDLTRYHSIQDNKKSAHLPVFTENFTGVDVSGLAAVQLAPGISFEVSSSSGSVPTMTNDTDDFFSGDRAIKIQAASGSTHPRYYLKLDKSVIDYLGGGREDLSLHVKMKFNADTPNWLPYVTVSYKDTGGATKWKALFNGNLVISFLSHLIDEWSVVTIPAIDFSSVYDEADFDYILSAYFMFYFGAATIAGTEIVKVDSLMLYSGLYPDSVSIPWFKDGVHPAPKHQYLRLGDNRNAQGYGTAAPTTGAWKNGDIIWNSAPSVGSTPGWQCTTAGTPGTWTAWFGSAASPTFNGLYVSGEGIKTYNADVGTYGGYHYTGVLGTRGHLSGTGTMQIKMPKDWTNTIVWTKIVGYDYSAGKSIWEVLVGGYSYAVTPQWLNVGATIRGKAPFSSVRLARTSDGNRLVVLLGGMTTVWGESYIVVSDVYTWYAAHDSGWGTNWDIEILADEDDITHSQSTDPTTVSVYTGTAPSSSPADLFQMYSADIAAGNAAPHFRTENGKIVKLYQQVLTAGLEEAYETPELDSEAKIIAAINATNAKVNDLIEALHNTGLLASS